MKTLEELKQEVLNEYDERVIALAQHLELDVDFEEEDFAIQPDEKLTKEEIAEVEKEKQEALDEAINDFRNELDNIIEDYNNTYSYGNGEYLVLTDSEADEEEDERLNNYLEECIMPEIPEHLQNYFDDEAWKRDARMDGRGQIISTYDGCEYEETVEGTTYYIYRV